MDSTDTTDQDADELCVELQGRNRRSLERITADIFFQT